MDRVQARDEACGPQQCLPEEADLSTQRQTQVATGGTQTSALPRTRLQRVRRSARAQSDATHANERPLDRKRIRRKGRPPIRAQPQSLQPTGTLLSQMLRARQTEIRLVFQVWLHRANFFGNLLKIVSGRANVP